MSQSADIAIVGGGIVGLTLARELAIRRPELSIVVLDKEKALGAHASGRNSGVLHAGFYYAPDSLKSHLTRRGNELLRAFCADTGVQVRSCGKVVVATDESELPGLEALARRGEANGVDLEIIDATALRQLEPLAQTVDRALWSPTTGVADPQQVLDALAIDVARRGVSLRLGAKVEAGRPGELRVNGRTMSVSHVVNAAGLYADRIADWFGFCDDYVMLPFKGVYLYGDWQPGRLHRHVYPVPDPRNPFLGVHFTVTVQGKAKIGPTAIPVGWRENYKGFDGFDRKELSEVAHGLPRFLGSDAHNSVGLITSEVPKYSRRYLARQARRLVPSASYADFRTRGRPGIRAQLMNRRTGHLEMDFVVRGDEHSTHVLNAVSPAWTSSLAVAEHVADRMAEGGVI